MPPPRKNPQTASPTAASALPAEMAATPAPPVEPISDGAATPTAASALPAELASPAPEGAPNETPSAPAESAPDASAEASAPAMPLAAIAGTPTELPSSDPVVMLAPPPAPEPVEVELAKSTRPASQADIPPCPPLGTRLVCEDFGEVEPGFTVAAEVRDFFEDRGEVILWIASLGRRWVIPSWVIKNGKWTHFPGDYPPPGESASFDARYRTAVKSVDAPTPKPKPVVRFAPPRDARPGHQWVEIAASAGLVNAIGYTLAGERKIRDWLPGDKGEIETRAVAGSPELFKTL